MTTETLELQEVYRLTNKAIAGKGISNPFIDTVYGSPPWEVRPSDAINFYPKTSVALPAIGAQATVVTFTVPDGYDGLLEEFSISFTGGGFVNGSGDVVFRLLRNLAPVRNFENMISEYGTQDTPVDIGRIRIFGGNIYIIQVDHIANAGLNGNVVGALRGYYYPNRGR